MLLATTNRDPSAVMQNVRREYAFHASRYQASFFESLRTRFMDPEFAKRRPRIRIDALAKYCSLRVSPSLSET
ncbi:MAG: hypothetical protein AAF989_02185 [Planctomycetota bacterium]